MKYQIFFEPDGPSNILTAGVPCSSLKLVVVDQLVYIMTLPTTTGKKLAFIGLF